MYKLNEIEFKRKCSQHLCPRKTSRNPKCSSEKKQQRCYQKYLNKIIKDRDLNEVVDTRWEEIKRTVQIRDKRCRIWVMLSNEERSYIQNYYYSEYAFLSKTLDVEHIIMRSKDKTKYYDLDNLILISRYFHTLLTQFRHPVYRTHITQEERYQILEQAKVHQTVSR